MFRVTSLAPEPRSLFTTLLDIIYESKDLTVVSTVTVTVLGTIVTTTLAPKDGTENPGSFVETLGQSEFTAVVPKGANRITSTLITMVMTDVGTPAKTTPVVPSPYPELSTPYVTSTVRLTVFIVSVRYESALKSPITLTIPLFVLIGSVLLKLSLKKLPTRLTSTAIVILEAKLMATARGTHPTSEFVW